MSARDNHVIGVMSRCESNESRSLVTSRKYLRKIRLVKKDRILGLFYLRLSYLNVPIKFLVENAHHHI